MSALPFDVRLAAATLFAAPVAAILLGFLVVRRVRPEWTHWPILASCLAVSAAGARLAAYVYARGGFDYPLFLWAAAPGWHAGFGLRVDGLCAPVLFMVCVVGSLIHVYAAGYMKGDPGFARFFLVFHLFFLAMLGLLTADDYVQLYLFWELVGVCSYLLVGYWYHKESARRAALKAFLVNRVGDLGFLFALLVMLVAFRTTSIQLVYLKLYSANGAASSPLLPVIGLGLVWAACAKSAQFPLYFWLPDAMEGPTPTSALMHAATMVTAGVFLLARSWPLIAAVRGLPELIAGIGAVTALGAALVAGMKKDLKRILAYSTVSHLGLMMLALGLGQVAAAVFHLVVHGFFKAALFLCAGNVAHSLHQPTASVDDTGGFKRFLPATWACFLAASLSAAGIPPFGGFFSKDAILDAAWRRGGWIALAGLLVAAASAFYMARMLLLAFHGDRPEQARGAGAHPHEAGPDLLVPVGFLALGGAVAGVFKAPLERMLELALKQVPAGIVPGIIVLPGEARLPEFSATVSALGTGMAALGVVLAWRLTMSDPGWDWRWRGGRVEALLESDFGWKRVVDAVVAAVRGAARLVGRGLDKGLWDGLIESSAGFARGLGGSLAGAVQGRLNDALWWMAAGAALLVGRAVR